MTGRPIGSYEYTPEELKKEVETYFAKCDATLVVNSAGCSIPKPKTISGLRKWLRVGKNYINQKRREPDFSGIIEQIYDEIEEDVQYNASLGFTNSTIAVRNLAANFGWAEKTEVEQKTEMKVLFSELSDEELEKLISE